MTINRNTNLGVFVVNGERRLCKYVMKPSGSFYEEVPISPLGEEYSRVDTINGTEWVE